MKNWTRLLLLFSLILLGCSTLRVGVHRPPTATARPAAGPGLGGRAGRS